MRNNTKYRTIVADPPWHYETVGGYSWRKGAPSGETRAMLDYPTMSVEEIKALPVADFTYSDTRPERSGSTLFLWTTTQYLVAAHEVCEAWRFKPTAVLVWCKPSRGFSVGGTFQANVEFILVGRRGAPNMLGRANTRWFEWPRGRHSAKPDAFFDVVESVSPGPYLELFARRKRLGWDAWGNEVDSDVEIAA